MTSLDLSFIQKIEPQAKAERVEGLDLSFVQKGSLDPIAPIKTKDNRTLLQKGKDLFTGEDRRTELTDSLPELFESGLFSGTDISGLKELGLTAQAMVTLDVNELADIISTNVPDIVKIENKDAMGNIIPVLHNRNNKVTTIINRPGLSGMDAQQGVSLAAAFAPAVSTAGASIPASMAQVGLKSAGIQTGIEGAQALSGGNFDPENIAFAAIGGGAFEGLGQAFGRALPLIKRSIQSGNISQKVRQKFMQEAENLGIPQNEITDDVIKAWAAQIDDRTGLEREFNTTLTQGQRTGSQPTLSKEDSFRAGIKGDKAQDVFLAEEAAQLQSLTKAAADMQADVARGAPLISSRNEAGAAIRQGVQNAEAVADDAITQAYNQVGDATLSADGFQGLLRATRKSVDSFEFPKEGNQSSFKALLSEIKKAERVLGSSQKVGAKIKPVHMKKLESIRRAIGNYADAAANQTEKRNILQMKTAFDDYLDDAVIKGLFDGDTQSLQSLKSARGIFKEYMQKFGVNTTSSRLGRGSDSAGSFIKKIILENPTDEQVINSLWATSGFNKQAAAKTAQRYKQILGADSDEWNMLRQAAFEQLAAKKTIDGKTVIDGAKMASNLDKAKNSGMSLLRELFTREELAKINRFAVLAKRTAPSLARSRENPSGTAQKLFRTLSTGLPFLDSGYSMAGTGAILFKGRRNASAAKQAFRPFRKVTATGTAVEAAATGQSPEIVPSAGDVLLDTFGQASQSSTGR